jgi:hypothetical protein
MHALMARQWRCRYQRCISKTRYALTPAIRARTGLVRHAVLSSHTDTVPPYINRQIEYVSGFTTKTDMRSTTTTQNAMTKQDFRRVALKARPRVRARVISSIEPPICKSSTKEIDARHARSAESLGFTAPRCCDCLTHLSSQAALHNEQHCCTFSSIVSRSGCESHAVRVRSRLFCWRLLLCVVEWNDCLHFCLRNKTIAAGQWLHVVGLAA